MMTKIDVQAQRRAKGLFINHPELKKNSVLIWKKEFKL